MRLTRDNWVTILFGVGSIVLTVALNILVVEEWRKPDVRYGRGGAYIHSKLALATVVLKNWGGSDAENVTIAASFADPFLNISTDRVTSPFERTDGGIDKKSVIGTIKRLAPGEVVNIYFTTEPSSPWVDQRPVIRDIKSHDGLGKPGVPILRIQVPSFLAAIAVWALFLIPLYHLARWHRRGYEGRYNEAIQWGMSAAQEGLSEEQLQARVEERRNAMPFFGRPGKTFLTLVAQAAFTGARQSPTQTPGRMT